MPLRIRPPEFNVGYKGTMDASEFLWCANAAGVSHAFLIEAGGSVATTSLCESSTEEECDEYVERPRKPCQECQLRLTPKVQA